MSIRVPKEEYDRWVREGLIPAEDPRPAVAQPRGKKEKRELVAALFVGPGTWVIPLYVQPIANGPALKRQMIGRAGRDRRVVAHELAKNLRALAGFVDHMTAGGVVKCKLVRLSRGRMDGDNLRVASKYCRDTIALFLGVDDGEDGSVLWDYAQETSVAAGLRIELEKVATGKAEPPRS